MRWLRMAVILWASSTGINATEPATEDPASAVPPTGALIGRFVLDGDPPPPSELELIVLSHIEYKVPDESLLVDKSGGIANVVVWARNKNLPTPPADNLVPVTLTLREGRFSPHVLAVDTRREIVLKNEGDFTTSFCLDANDYPCVMVRPEEQRTLRSFITPVWQPPSRIYLQSDKTIKPAWLLKRPNSFMAVSDPQGNFRLENLPLGKHDFQVWHELADDLNTATWPEGRFSVEIKPGDNDLGTIKLPVKLFPKPPKPVATVPRYGTPTLAPPRPASVRSSKRN